MSVHAKIKLPWLLLMLLASIKVKATVYLPSSGDWTCRAGVALVNRTLSGGIQAGEFKNIGAVTGMLECVRWCCNEEKCNVALMAKGNCYLVSCNNEVLCRPVPAQATDLSPSITFVQHISPQPQNNALKTFLANAPKRTTRRAHMFRLSVDQSPNKRVDILKTNPTPLNPTKAELFFQEQVNNANTEKVTSNGCYPSTIHKFVSLKYGPDSGDFFDYGKIGSMKQCVNLCCKDKQCDVAFMVDSTCYTVSCYTLEKCEMVPASKTSRLTSQLAYVIKKTDIDRKQKLLISKKHEQKLIRKQNEDERWMFHRDRDRLPPSVDSTTEEPNIPQRLTEKCRHNNIMLNYAMIGGQKAGIYTFRGITPGFSACLDLCCADLFCDAAFLLGKRCYSVQCYKNGKCAGRPARSNKIHSTLAFIQRSDDGLDLSEKRTAIPGLLPTDRQYTVWLNITSEEYKEEMVDSESLEFLNFAETLRGMLTGLYGDIDGFRFVEVLKFKPKILVAVFNLTADVKTAPKVLLQRIVDVIRRGELKSHDDPRSQRLSVDVRGFQFLNSDGENMVCLPEFNYDVHWPLGVFETFVSIPCPRKANGLATRSCAVSDNYRATWRIPDFSDCVTDKYESLLREVQLLSSTSIQTPDLTTASIIDRLLQLTVEDTYGTSPPKAFEAINKLQQESVTPSGKFKLNPLPEQMMDQVKFANPAANPSKEEVPVDQLKSYLRKMGLSALLGRTHKPDMMSLYKSLSSKVGEDDKTKATKLTGSSSIHYPSPKIEKTEEYSPIVSAHPAENHHEVAVEKTFHNFNPSIKAHPIDILKAHRKVHWWGPPKPIGELGAESPIMPGSEAAPFVMPSQPYRSVAERSPQLPEIHHHQPVKAKTHDLSYKPVSIERIDYEPNVRSPPSKTKLLNSPSNRVLTSQDLMNLSPEELHKTITTMQKHQNEPHASKPHDVKAVSRDNLASYFTHTQGVPNGIPMYENKRGKPVYPPKEDYAHSIRKRSSSDSELEQLVYFIKKRRASDDEIPELFKEERAKRDVDEDVLDTFLNSYDKSQQKSHNRKRRNVDASLLESLSAPEPEAAMTRLYGTATLTEIPMPDSGKKKEESGVGRSNFPPKKVIHIDDNLETPPSDDNELSFYIPYKKEMEKPTIVDVPTGEQVHEPLQVSSINFEENRPATLVVKSLSFDDNTELNSESKTQSSSSSVAQILKPSIHVTADSSEVHSKGAQVSSSKVTSSVDVKCKTNGVDCPPKNNFNKAVAAPDSKVMRETQVSEPVQVDMESEQPEPTPSTTTTITSTQPPTTATTTAIPPTTGLPPTAPTLDPYKEQLNDETQPEEPTKPPPVTKPVISITAVESKPKPEISITVVDKTDGVKIDTNIETGGEAPKPTPQKTTTQKVEESTPPFVETTKKPKKKKEETNLIFSYEKGEGGDKAPMFGGDILISIEIADKITKYMQDHNGGPTLQEVEEFLQAASAVIDEKNEEEWKNTVRRLKVLREDENAGETRDFSTASDWRSMQRQKMRENTDILMDYIDTIETYGKTVSRLFTHYNVKLQEPIITKNIIMQIRIVVVEELLEKDNNEVIFPEYKEDARLAKWSSGVEQISLPSSLITEKFEQTKSIYIVFFRIKNIAHLQRARRDFQTTENKDIVDESPIKVASQLLSMSVEPPLGADLKKPVSITFANEDLSQGDLPHDCAYWNSTKKSWEDNGCELTFTNASVTTCQCNHLTTFSVLVDTSSKVAVTTTASSLLPVTTTPEPVKPPEPVELEPVEAAPPPSIKPSTMTTSTTTITTSAKPDVVPTKAIVTGGLEEKNRNWLLIILIILLALLLLMLCICCLCLCNWWCKKRRREKVEEQVAEEEEPVSSIGTTSLVDKSNVKEEPVKGIVKSGSTTTSRTGSSPEPGHSPGWRKLMTNAQHPKQMLLKEKAILFKDYVQPYHFLSKERPNTSAESIYGSTIGSAPPLSKSDVSSSSPRRQKRVYEPKQRRNLVQPRLNAAPPAKTPSPVSSPEVKRERRSRVKRAAEEAVVPTNMADAHSMEWDPYLDNKEAKAKARRNKRNISPISEEGEESHEPKASLEAQNGSDESQFSDASYPDTASRTDVSSDNASPLPKRSDKLRMVEKRSSGEYSPREKRDSPRTVEKSTKTSPRDSYRRSSGGSNGSRYNPRKTDHSRDESPRDSRYTSNR